ncbi:hypothetical protein TTHERM_000849419 (macronuclear) [Tetrahymena thermophila SB210]|uniref:Uncharacterized protein n=1 Tax=Tetrahymena thermophila (strain SB210) TaxID=312017 RepID=W7X8A6_TETTS|nr:hypothetical protein TTHERM_000849419 [Tetrahymena thermophila SB210]EWS73582.1 hypothetical protein TTHERM_000849419 [Tetrahymena thermophila SB210]|eukprot:XP_012653878.1 hypothetical protein TTHERM_000849419 [Tetrahymena thermophila SB210]
MRIKLVLIENRVMVIQYLTLLGINSIIDLKLLNDGSRFIASLRVSLDMISIIQQAK